MGQSGIVPYQPKLIEHGIQTERAEIRCHVAPGTRLIFVFRTAPLLSLDLTKYAEGWAGQPGVNYKTARGYKVPIADIPGLRVIRARNTTLWWEDFDEAQLPPEKGKLAVSIATRLLRAGRFPLWHGYAQESQRLEVQRNGTDILLYGKWTIQVKCDFWAGPKGAFGRGTGNLFLQTAELNPLGRF